ncbi:hypothetical protein DAERI_030334 [Deinococcus aerius]|uniref:ATPase AAA-type core domain-containing protein n=1 Tax=Deinococcus aerius TaxID=200253 RepID=A0A2I9DGC3_9DEIO|nr:hypothetical protein DAERI_030334 [Deinococcus aerius]
MAEVARLKELQIILTTHSPYVLEEIPSEGRVYIMDGASGKSIVTGVSPEFAMTRMDEEQHPECDIYVEDEIAKKLMSEMLFIGDKDVLSRCQIIPFGSAQVGIALGMMASQNRFPRPSLVFLDGDQTASPGCNLLPGGDVPERVVFESLAQKNWGNVYERIGRQPSETIDALNRSMTQDDHHDWLKSAANELVIGTDTLWQALASVWAGMPENVTDIANVTDKVRQALI